MYSQIVSTAPASPASPPSFRILDVVPSFIGQFHSQQCTLNTIDQISKENSVEELWKQTKPILQQKNDNIKKCVNDEQPNSYVLIHHSDTYFHLSINLFIGFHNFSQFSCVSKEVVDFGTEYGSFLSQLNLKALPIVSAVTEKCIQLKRA